MKGKKIIIAVELVVLLILSIFVASLVLNIDHPPSSMASILKENKRPTVSVSSDKTSGKEPLKVSFKGYGTDIDGSIESYYWDFGDGETSKEQNPTHLYDTPGSYTAYLIVTDDKGDTAKDTITIHVVKNKPPTAYAYAIPSGNYAPTTIQFYGYGTDEDGVIVDEEWSGGVYSTNNQYAYIYATIPGFYTAEFTVTDDNGATDSTLVSVYVYEKTVMSVLKSLFSRK